nr:hypothetical protein [uncultured Rhodopila sp.]
MSRETIMTALFTLLTVGGAFQTTGRRLIHWSKVPQQPALFLRNADGGDYPQRTTRLPPKVTLDCEVWLYCNDGSNPDVAPAIGLNNAIDAVEAALKPAPGFEAQTLGGLVSHCWIEGKIDMHPGDLDGQAIAIVPVKLLVPSFGG